MSKWDIENPESAALIDRKTLWSVWTIIMSTDFDKRDEYWDQACVEVKRLLKATRGG